MPGPAPWSGAILWTASPVPLETGLNLITLTAVDASSNEASTSITVNLSNPAPEIFVDPLTMDFGTVPVGSATEVRNFTVRNDGTLNLVLGTITLGGASPTQFKQPAVSDFCSGHTLAPQASCLVGVKFRPSIVGPQNATLVIPSNDSDEPSVIVTLSGTGGATAPEIFVSPTSLAFGTVPPGSATAVQNVTVRNDGTANLILGTITLGGANADQFKQPAVNDFCSGHTLAPLATCLVGREVQADERRRARGHSRDPLERLRRGHGHGDAGRHGWRARDRRDSPVAVVRQRAAEHRHGSPEL